MEGVCKMDRGNNVTAFEQINLKGRDSFGDLNMDGRQMLITC
jgi:hypothetical protein